MLTGAAAAIRRLNGSNLPVVLITNQSGVGRGYFPESLVHEVHQKLLAELTAAGARLDGVYYCPHVSSDGCACRKPQIGMLQQAAGDLQLDLKRSFVIGDRSGDVELAHRAGSKSILVRTGYGEGELAWHAKDWLYQPHFVAADLAEAVDWILRESRA